MVTGNNETGSIRPEAVVVPCIFATIFLIGIMGNGTLIYIVSRYKGMRNTPNLYLVSLAAGDILLLVVSVPITSTIYTLPEWPFGGTMCKVNEFLQTVSLGISVFTLTALSADRYSVIAKPIIAHKVGTSKRAYRVTAMVWLVSTLFAIPDLFQTKLRKGHFGNGNYLKLCQVYPKEFGETYKKVHSMLRFLIYFAAPIMVIASFYALMARVLLRSSTKGFYSETSNSIEIEGIGSSQLRKQMVARKRVAKAVLSFVVVFVVCWLPRQVYILWYHYDDGQYNMFWHIFKILGLCLSYTNSCLNPFALYLLSRQFREHYNRLLFSRVKCKRYRKSRSERRRRRFDDDDDDDKTSPTEVGRKILVVVGGAVPHRGAIGPARILAENGQRGRKPREEPPKYTISKNSAPNTSAFAMT